MTEEGTKKRIKQLCKDLGIDEGELTTQQIRDNSLYYQVRQIYGGVFQMKIKLTDPSICPPRYWRTTDKEIDNMASRITAKLIAYKQIHDAFPVMTTCMQYEYRTLRGNPAVASEVRRKLEAANELDLRSYILRYTGIYVHGNPIREKTLEKIIAQINHFKDEKGRFPLIACEMQYLYKSMKLHGNEVLFLLENKIEAELDKNEWNEWEEWIKNIRNKYLPYGYLYFGEMEKADINVG